MTGEIEIESKLSTFTTAVVPITFNGKTKRK